MKNLNKLKRFSQKDKFALPEMLWINYAEDLGLDISYIDNTFVYNKNKCFYKIKGLYWKYETIKIIDNMIKNELFIGLERDYSNDYSKHIDNNIQNSIPALTIQLTSKTSCNAVQNTIPISASSNNSNNSNNSISITYNPNSTLISSLGNNAISYAETTRSITKSIEEENQKLNNRLFVLEQGYLENTLIRYPASNEVFLSIQDFCENFTLNNEKIPYIQKNIKFEIKITF